MTDQAIQHKIRYNHLAGTYMLMLVSVNHIFNASVDRALPAMPAGYVMADLEALCKRRPEAMIQAALEVLDE